MKNIALLFIIALLPSLVFSQSSVRKFYKKVNKSGETVKMSLPGFLIHMGAGIARKHTDDDPDAKLALEMTKYIKNIKIVVAQDQNAIDQDDYKKLVNRAKSKDKFEDLLMVKDGETNVNIMMRGNSKKIKNLLILVNDGDEFVMLSMKTNLKYKHLNQFLSEILKKEDKIKLKPKATKKAVTKTIKRA